MPPAAVAKPKRATKAKRPAKAKASAAPKPYPDSLTGFAPKRMSWEAFTRLDGLPHNNFEYVDGHAVEIAMVSRNHTDLRNFLITSGNIFCGMTGYGRCSGEPDTIRMSGGNGRCPDVFFVSKAQDEQRGEHALHGPADLVIEVLSESTRRVDYGAKFDEYAAAGCREYWLLDPDKPHHDFFVLRDGHFRPHLSETGDDGVEVVRSASIDGLWFRLDWFAKRPPANEVLAAWKLAPA